MSLNRKNPRPFRKTDKRKRLSYSNNIVIPVKAKKLLLPLLSTNILFFSHESIPISTEDERIYLTFFFNKRIIYIFKAYRKYTQSSRILHLHQSRDISFQTMPLSRSHTKRSHTVYSRSHTKTSLDSIFTLQLIVSAVALSFEQQQ